MTDLRDQLQQSLGDAFALERELGGGGMSRVFLATERTLGRRVVVKVLPAELAGGVSSARFHREISLAARLQHPHLVPLLSAGEMDGLPYYTMPYVEGESLRARLSHGELPVAEAISILRDVARALQYAHARGVVHRDIKPDNVLLAGHSAVVTDLGVAKAVAEAATGAGTITATGIALGTPAYMAPEQAAGDPATDHRADIYAFGVMAYEMLAGHAPFAGRSMQAMLAAHAVERPPDLATLRPAAPPRLADLVMRCLAKRPGDRPQTADELVRELDAITAAPASAAADATLLMPAVPGGVASHPPHRRIGTGTHPSRRVVVGAMSLLVIVALAAGVTWRWRAGRTDTAIQSIAVLPFENTSGDSAFQYLEDGISDQVRDALNVLPGITVKARRSSQQMKSHDAREIGGKLHVDAVLQGAFSGSQTRLHVTVELVRTSDDAVLWSATYDGRSNQLIGIQDTITQAITRRLRVAPPAAATVDIASRGSRGTANDTAYDLMLRGRYAFDHADFPASESYLRRALAADPHFARARAYLAVTQAALPLIGIGPLDSLNMEVRRNADEALAVDSTVVEAYIAESNALSNDLRLAEALTPLERGMAIDRNQPNLLLFYAQALAAVGRMPEALAAARQAHERDPLSVSAWAIYGYYLAMSGRVDEGLAQMQGALALDPNQPISQRAVGYWFAFDGHPDSALAHLQRSFALDSSTYGGRSNLVFGYASTGRWADAERERARFARNRRSTSGNYERATVELAFGEYDNAMTSLERSVQAREPLLWIPSLPCDPLFDPLKANPRFDLLMKRLGAKACAPRLQWPIARPPRRQPSSD